MLTQLSIKNFAIVETLEIDLDNGMTVITGETGAGKSIVIDALGLVLGGRASSNTLRDANKKAEISASFDISNISAATTWLEDNEMSDEGFCIIRRIINPDGRSRCFINNTPTTLQALKQLGEKMITIHGQHENQALVKADYQRELLDAYANCKPTAKETEQAYNRWRSLTQELETCHNLSSDASSRADFLKFQLTELEQLELQQDEYQQIDQELSQQQYASDILANRESAIDLLSESTNSAQNQLIKAQTAIEAIKQHDSRLENASVAITHALIQTEETINELKHHASSFDLDPEKLSYLEQRMSTIHTLARKHHVKPEELVALTQKLQQELSQLDNSAEKLELLEKQIATALTDYHACAEKLSKSRIKSAKKLNKLITEKMATLGMPHGKFAIEITSCDPSPHGNETISFLVNTNPGMTLQPLGKIASGGEISRISLAIQVITAKHLSVPVLIFDEVDVGIGGSTADVVGEQLAQLGTSQQVLCITHLAQVAAKAQHQFQVIKHSTKTETHTTLTELDAKARIQEIARMMGGKTITKQTLAHAEEMLG